VADKQKQPQQPAGGLDVNAILAQLGPPPTVDTDKRQPLGPPTAFYGERAAAGVAPAPGFQPFLQGDQWVPASQPSENRARLQAKMNAAGLYGTQGYIPGVWTNDDAAAYQVVLENANATGVSDPERALDLFAQQARVKSPKAKQPRAPLVVQYADPESIRQVVRDSSLTMLGKRLSDAEEQRIISGYQAYTAAGQRQAYAAGGDQYGEGGGGSVTKPMGYDEYARAQIESSHPAELGAQRYLDGFGAIVKSLGTVVNQPPLVGGS
jgi:hypothetical protein